MDAFLAAFFGPRVHLDFAMYADFARRPGADVGITAAVGHVNADGTIDLEGFIKRAFGGGLRATSREQDGCEERQRNPRAFA